MVEVNRMRLGRFEFVIDFGSFRRITACWSGPGWDFNFSGACVNDDPEKPTFSLAGSGCTATQPRCRSPRPPTTPGSR